ncbi:universal stress protein [Nocardia seriolae]|uniref:Universal stress protein n=1 Tax=Nocardia seriolae TaxID=37332 RepID=A0ABC8AWD8_9NOCA|nr:universal stress protein [Nocardia seriolae]APA98363.1 Universal stress protein [Nocardia seriolae]MTJ63035.1 universal stress protein [Nocardia seriolae]MTJ74906.1 universal stress protein [Nocardia seriolae]MTJ88060.1 universal stress protein [Nocardia seriolae]MTK32050.1 universal stress protein [Nocardia seriolae]
MSDTAVPATESGAGSVNPPILVGADGSEISYQAVAWAATEAAARGCPLHIVVSYALTIGMGPVPELSEADQRAVREQATQVLADAERMARLTVPGDTLPITTELIFELIAPALIDRSSHARLVVVGSRGLGAVRRAILGSVSIALARHAHCPVVVVHGDPEAAADGKPIVVGVDRTANSVPAIELAFEEAALRKADLIAVHSWSDSSGFDLPVMGWEAIRATEDKLLGAALSEYRKRYPEVVVRQVVASDTPARALLELAEDAQLVVVGSHGRGGFAGMVLGSVSTTMLHSAHCPVLVVRSS